jgi:23S rRNA (cytidine1920-2'-O)/16S rRNA (cytidine1409-2'-O)-methyltransferase
MPPPSRPGGRKRLDDLLVDRALAPSKQQAQRLIRAGQVRSGTVVLDKPGREVKPDLPLEVTETYPFVSRGAEKLRGFLEAFPLPVAGLRFLDVGASTGGFTDFLLQAGAAEATCVDVGHGQLHYRLRQDPRVKNLERMNARHLRPADLPHPSYPLVVMDLSFISLTKVWPAVWPLVSPGGHLVALVKPQFEAGKAEVDAGRGVIRDPSIHQRVLDEMRAWVAAHLAGAVEIGCCESPLRGADGNLEFVCGWKNVAGARPGPQGEASP